MNEIGKTKLSNQTKFKLDEIKKIGNYFLEEINQRLIFMTFMNIVMIFMNIVMMFCFFLIEHLHRQKKNFVCVCVYKMLTYSIKTWKNIIGVEVIKYNE